MSQMELTLTLEDQRKKTILKQLRHLLLTLKHFASVKMLGTPKSTIYWALKAAASAVTTTEIYTMHSVIFHKISQFNWLISQIMIDIAQWTVYLHI